jgi:hypothetical protein
MSWDLHHTESERLAQEAQGNGDVARARELYRRAAEAEARALVALDPAKSRTRAITAVSALSLWLKAGCLEMVETKGQELLADGSLPEFAQAQIREIVEQAAEGRRGEQREFEVEITFQKTLRYTVRAPDRVAAEKQAVTRWRRGDEANLPSSDGCELLQVQAHAAAPGESE